MYKMKWTRTLVTDWTCHVGHRLLDPILNKRSKAKTQITRYLATDRSANFETRYPLTTCIAIFIIF